MNLHACLIACFDRDNSMTEASIVIYNLLLHATHNQIFRSGKKGHCLPLKQCVSMPACFTTCFDRGASRARNGQLCVILKS